MNLRFTTFGGTIAASQAGFAQGGDSIDGFNSNMEEHLHEGWYCHYRALELSQDL
jgi:hypothetical protein